MKELNERTQATLDILVAYSHKKDGLSFTEIAELANNYSTNKGNARKIAERAMHELLVEFAGLIGFYIKSASPRMGYYLTGNDNFNAYCERNNLNNKPKLFFAKRDLEIISMNHVMDKMTANFIGDQNTDILYGSMSKNNKQTRKTSLQHHEWINKIMVSSRYQSLYLNIEKKNRTDTGEICSALFRGEAFQGQYLGGKLTIFWPVKLLRQEQVLYVLCKTIDHPDYVKEYSLHRFSNVKTLKIKPPENITISYDKEIIESEWIHPIEPQKHRFIENLILEFTGAPAQHMSEVRFHKSENAKYKTFSKVTERENKPGGKAISTRVTVTHIPYDYIFKTWILGFGRQVKVIQPGWLVEEIKHEIEETCRQY